ncbi:hypothetical protein V2J09_019251 [Rumex salicifolius]
MEMESILKFLENKTLLVTGATGFVSKILVEKILRTQPNLKKLYLLVRATDVKSANQRFKNEIIGKELFKVLKEKMGENFESFVTEKVKMVSGDITCQDDLEIKEASFKDDMFQNLDVIINLAANTNFDERYDASLLLNTFGAKNVLEFAKKCINLKVLVHVSTAYVWGERGGLILERSCEMGETLNGTRGLDIDEEKRVMEIKLIQLQSQGITRDEIKLAMKDFGLERARKYGWPNTYVFTKALGEMLLMEHKQHLPVVIIRPTIVTSTYKEPFPGWVEGIRTIDSIAVGYGKGRLTFFAGDPECVLDVVPIPRFLYYVISICIVTIYEYSGPVIVQIPGDMVVNATLVAMVAHATQQGETGIYHVGSSVRNPLYIADFQNTIYRYFKNNPCVNKEGKPVIVSQFRVLGSMDSFNKYLYLRYLLPLKVLELVNTALCQYFERTYTDLNRKINVVMRFLDLYKPYLFFKGVFDDLNTEKLRMRAMAEADVFYFDPKEINWEDYFLRTHFPGLVKYVLK